MVSKPLISVITVTLNSEKTVAKAIESVLNQTYDRVEYIIMDGGSTDSTVQVAEEYKERFAAKGYELKIVSEPDRGMYDALNKGVALATGDIIGQINSDDWYEPEALETVANKFMDDPFDLFWSDLRILKKTGNIIKKARIRKVVSTKDWNHPTTFIRAEVYKNNPYSLISMYDDFELILRLRKQGVKMAIENKVLANFVFGGMSTKKDFKDTLRRIKLSCNNYKINGYGLPYYIDRVAIEMAKFIFG